MAEEVEYASMSDGELIQLSREGDTSAFGILISRHRDRVYGQVFKMIPNHDGALDLSQDVWVKVWTRLYQFQGDSPFTTWLTRIAINVCLDHIRKKRRRPIEESIEELTEKNGDGDWVPTVKVDPLKGMAREEVLVLLEEAFKGISPEQRTALEYMYYEQLEYKEIAQRMNCSHGTVMSRLFYGKKALMKRLKSILEQRGIDLKIEI